MLNNWKNFKKEKPKLVHKIPSEKGQYEEFSDQCLFFIDGRPYIGIYFKHFYEKDKLDKDSKDRFAYSITTGSYADSLSNIIYRESEEDYEKNRYKLLYTDVGEFWEEDYNNLDVYWHSIDTLGILCAIDLLKKEEEEE